MPSIFLQQYKLPELPCLNINSDDDEETGTSPLKNTSDSEMENSNISEEDGMSNEPTLHLVKPIQLSKGNLEFTAGISGIELSHRYLKELVY